MSLELFTMQVFLQETKWCILAGTEVKWPREEREDGSLPKVSPHLHKIVTSFTIMNLVFCPFNLLQYDEERYRYLQFCIDERAGLIIIYAISRINRLTSNHAIPIFKINARV